MINFPNINDLFNAFVAKFKENKPDIDPTVKGSWSYSFGKGISNLGFSIVLVVKELLKQFFPQTATGIFLDYWGAFEGLERLDPTASIGNIAVPGVASTIIDAEEIWQGNNGIFYTNSANATITDQVILLSSLVYSSGTVTVTANANHNLANGLTVTISGADYPEYEGDFEIIVLNETQFTYEIPSAPAGPSVNGQANCVFASVAVQAQTNGSDTNLISGSELTYQGGIVGIDETGIADYVGLTGGADLEDQEAYRARILLSRSQQEGVFTEDQIKLAALSVNGNTRVFVKGPNSNDISQPGAIVPGQVKAYVLRDNDSPITPSQPILDLTKKAIIEDGKLPTNQWEDEVFVEAPTIQEVDFDFTALEPNTGTMRSAIESQLNAYFTDEARFGTDLDEDVLRGVVINTQDLTTGEFIESFDFTATPLIIDSDALPVLGVLTWPSI